MGHENRQIEHPAEQVESILGSVTKRLSLIDKTVAVREDYEVIGRNLMPVNMDPSKKRRRPQAITASAAEDSTEAASAPPRQTFGEETEADREKDLADAESKNLWDATEVIDMDRV
ncbi:MAG: hypothetical protein AB7F94_04175 [Nitrospira sp.]